MTTRDDRLCRQLRDVLTTARSAADGGFLEHTHALVGALLINVEATASATDVAMAGASTATSRRHVPDVPLLRYKKAHGGSPSGTKPYSPNP